MRISFLNEAERETFLARVQTEQPELARRTKSAEDNAVIVRVRDLAESQWIALNCHPGHINGNMAFAVFPRELAEGVQHIGCDVDGRIETGPLQINDDWPGLFIRGDNAMYLAMTIRHLIHFVKERQDSHVDLLYLKHLEHFVEMIQREVRVN